MLAVLSAPTCTTVLTSGLFGVPAASKLSRRSGLDDGPWTRRSGSSWTAKYPGAQRDVQPAGGAPGVSAEKSATKVAARAGETTSNEATSSATTIQAAVITDDRGREKVCTGALLSGGREFDPAFRWTHSRFGERNT